MYTSLIINNSLVIVDNGALPKQNSSQIAWAFNMACAIPLAEYVHNVDGKHSSHHSTDRPAGLYSLQPNTALCSLGPTTFSCSQLYCFVWVGPNNEIHNWYRLHSLAQTGHVLKCPFCCAIVFQSSLISLLRQCAIDRIIAIQIKPARIRYYLPINTGSLIFNCL